VIYARRAGSEIILIENRAKDGRAASIPGLDEAEEVVVVRIKIDKLSADLRRVLHNPRALTGTSL